MITTTPYKNLGPIRFCKTWEYAFYSGGPQSINWSAPGCADIVMFDAPNCTHLFHADKSRYGGWPWA